MVSISSAYRRFGLGALALAAMSAIANASMKFGSMEDMKIRSLEERASTTNRLVFAHLIVGTLGDRTSSSDYDNDMKLAAAAGIDAFALNIGDDSYTDTQLNYAYASAANNGMKVFLSFDFSSWSTSDASTVGSLIAQYGSQPAQLQVDGRVFASSFIGNALDVAAMKAAAGSNVFWAPNFAPGEASVDNVDAALNWMGWHNNGDCLAPTPGHNVTIADGDNAYLEWLAGKPYIAPVSCWFSTHYGPEVSYSKNFVYPSGSLCYDRWMYILEQDFPMLEILTWNDYGESHYIGPLSSKHYDDGNSKWANDMPHDGFVTLATPFIAAYKNGDTNVDQYITQDQIVYWYRRNLKTLNCDATDTTYNAPANNGSGLYFEGLPNGADTMSDDVYVVTLLTAAATLTVTSGGTTQTFSAPAGAKLFMVPANLGAQSYSLTRNGQTVLSGTSLMEITDVCNCGIYNFNAYVGTLPAGPSDPLGPDGLSSLTVGLHVTTCKPTPSLGTNPPSAFNLVNSPATTSKSTSTSTTANSPAATSKSTSTSSKSTSTSSKSTSISSTSTSTSAAASTQVCVAGTVAPGESANYTGLCSFTCYYGYCPVGPCVCTKYAATGNAPPATNGKNGCPVAGEGSGYDGLCSYTCSHGYCPVGACQYC